MGFLSLNLIPNNVFDLLWFKNGQYKNCDFQDSSAIDIELPIQVDGPIEEWNYYPDYSTISPRQRGEYLDWLKNINVGDNLGAVYLYYYGLEQHLYRNNLANESIEMIYYLTFKYNLKYGINLLACYASVFENVSLAKKMLENIELLKDIEANVFINLCYLVNGGLKANDFIILAKECGFTNTSYIKNNYDLMLEKINSLLDNGIFSLENIKFTRKSLYKVFPFQNLYLTDKYFETKDYINATNISDTVFRILSEAHSLAKASKSKTQNNQGNTVYKEKNSIHELTTNESQVFLALSQELFKAGLRGALSYEKYANGEIMFFYIDTFNRLPVIRAKLNGRKMWFRAYKPNEVTDEKTYFEFMDDLLKIIPSRVDYVIYCLDNNIY